MDNRETLDILYGKSKVKKRKKLKEIRLNLLNKEIISDEILSAFDHVLELESEKRDWETLRELFEIIGLLKLYKYRKIIYNNFMIESDNYDIIAMYAAKAYLRISRSKNIDYVELTKMDNYSVKEGVLEYLGYDSILPNEKLQRFFIEEYFKFGEDRAKGLTDPRYGLAAACYSWSENIVNNFLNECLLSQDSPLLYVAGNSLLRVKSKLR